jgi:hypothetical protein
LANASRKKYKKSKVDAS